MGWFGSKDDVAAWRAREDELQDKVIRLDDEVGMGDPAARAAYDELVEHHKHKPLRLWGRS